MLPLSVPVNPVLLPFHSLVPLPSSSSSSFLVTLPSSLFLRSPLALFRFLLFPFLVLFSFLFNFLFLAFIFLMWWCQYRADHKDRMEMVEMANIRAMNAYEAKRSYGTNA